VRRSYLNPSSSVLPHIENQNGQQGGAYKNEQRSGVTVVLLKESYGRHHRADYESCPDPIHLHRAIAPLPCRRSLPSAPTPKCENRINLLLASAFRVTAQGPRANSVAPAALSDARRMIACVDRCSDGSRISAPRNRGQGGPAPTMTAIRGGSYVAWRQVFWMRCPAAAKLSERQ
jgi:hypothetical protein